MLVEYVHILRGTINEKAVVGALGTGRGIFGLLWFENEGEFELEFERFRAAAGGTKAK